MGAFRIILVLFLLAPAIAQAQTGEELLEEGLRLRREGADEAAAERFQLAHERGAGANALAQLALAEQALGRWLDAALHLEAALADEANRWIRRNRRSLIVALETIHGHLGRIEISGNVEGARVRVNQRDAGVLPLAEPVRVEAGSVIVEAEADGYFTMQRPIEVSAERLARVELVLVPRAPEPEPEVESEPEPEPLPEPEVVDPPLPIVPPARDGTAYDTLLAGTVAAYSASVVAFIGMIVALAIYEPNVVFWNGCIPRPGESRTDMCPEEASAWRTALNWAIATGIVGVVAFGVGVGLTVELVGTPSSASVEVAGNF